jgi:NitT/TauT family transport system substrate-binding protein
MTGRIQAAYMLAPLVMDLADKRIPVKIVSLGPPLGRGHHGAHRLAYKKFSDLRGKRIAMPSRFAVDFLFLRKMLAREKMTPKDVEIIEMAPPDMPAALYAKAVDAYCTGEPFGAAAQRAGYARPLAMTRDEWRNYICCVLTVREELIKENRPLVQDLVNYMQAAGSWLDQGRPTATRPHHRRRTQILQPGPERHRFVMQNPQTASPTATCA